MEFIAAMEILGTIAFAAAGALVAIDRDLDYFGIALSAVLTAVGGGIVRDVLVNVPVPVSLQDPTYITISLITTAIVIRFHRNIKKYHNVVMFCDALGLAAFTALGAQVAVLRDVYMPFVVITMAILTGTGGGLIRDAISGVVPSVLKEEVYAVASLVGALAFMVTYPLYGRHIAVFVSFTVTLIIRLLSMKYHWSIKKVRKHV